MLAYCLNNATNSIDSDGMAAKQALSDDVDSIATPFEDPIGGGGLGHLALGALLLHKEGKPKPENLPSRKKVKMDMDHISSGHMPGGDRNPDGKKSVFLGLTARQVSKAIYEAYSTATKLKTQGDRIKLIGYSSTFNVYIEMWINVVTKIIETAYPK